MRLRRNSSSPHSSLSPGRAGKLATPTGRNPRRLSDISDSRNLRRSQRAESASPKAAERVLRPRSTSGRGLLDGSGFLSEEEGKKEVRTSERVKTPEEEEDGRMEAENGSSAEPRRSRRNKNLKYACYDPDYMTNEDVIRFQEQEKRFSPRKTRSHDRKEEHGEEEEEETEEESTGEDEETEEDSEETPPRSRSRSRGGRGESPFYNHVRFSPSAKPGSPSMAARMSRRDSRRLRNVRLHNLASEDEERVFNKRYSRDLRSRKRKETAEEEEEDGGAGETCPVVRRSSRAAAHTAREKMEVAEHSEDAGDEEEEEEEGDEERPKADRAQGENGDASASDTSGLRRSKRIHKPVVPEGEQAEEEGEEEEEGESESPSSEEDQEEEVQTTPSSRRQLPRRNRVPVDRLCYGPPPRMERRRSTELRNLDQYSSDEEFGADVSVARRGSRRYNMRENRRTISRYGEVGRSAAAAAAAAADKSNRHYNANRRDLR